MKNTGRFALYGKFFLICLLAVAQPVWAIFTTVWLSVDLNSMTVGGQRRAVADGAYTIEMQLVDSKALVVWSERNRVPIVANKFSVELGKINPLNPVLIMKNPGLGWKVLLIGGTTEVVKYDQKLPLSWAAGSLYADEAGHAAIADRAKLADRAKVADALSPTATVNGAQVVGQVGSAKTADSATVANSLAPTAIISGAQVVGQVASARAADTAAVANSLSATAKVNGAQIVGKVDSAKTADVANSLAPTATVNVSQIRGGGHGSGLDADLLDGKHLQEVIDMARAASATSRIAITVNQPGHAKQQGSLVVWDDRASSWDHPESRFSRCSSNPFAYGFEAYQENPGQSLSLRIESFCTAWHLLRSDEAAGIVEIVDVNSFRVVFTGQANALAYGFRGQNLVPGRSYWLDFISLTLTGAPTGGEPFMIATAVDAGFLLARSLLPPPPPLFDITRSVRSSLTSSLTGTITDPVNIAKPGRYAVSLHGLIRMPSGSEYIDSLRLCGQSQEEHFQAYPVCDSSRGECRQQLQYEGEVELGAGEGVQICSLGGYSGGSNNNLTATLRVRELVGR